jgi:hypothetical protein
MSKFATTELTLAKGVAGRLRKGMMCLADRLFPGYQLWRMAVKTGAICFGVPNGTLAWTWKSVSRMALT